MPRLRLGRLAIITGIAALSFTGTNVRVDANVVGGGAFVGQGTISPALTSNPQFVTGGLGGSMVGEGVINTFTSVVVVEVNGCSFSFASTGPGDDVEEGAGTFSGGCVGTASITVNSGSYVRIGALVDGTGSGTVNGISTTFIIVCGFIPTSAPAVGSFALGCVVSFN